LFCQTIVVETKALEALGAWRHMSPAKRSRSLLRLATRVERQATFDEADVMICLLWMCVVYEALGDISRVRCWRIPGVVAQDEA